MTPPPYDIVATPGSSHAASDALGKFILAPRYAVCAADPRKAARSIAAMCSANKSHRHFRNIWTGRCFIPIELSSTSRLPSIAQHASSVKSVFQPTTAVLAQCLEIGVRHKVAGNEMLAVGLLDNALAEYCLTLRLAANLTEFSLVSHGAKTLCMQAHLNTAQCHILAARTARLNEEKVRHWERGKQACDRAQSMTVTAKGWYRRALCNEGRGCLVDARNDAAKALQLAPDDATISSLHTRLHVNESQRMRGPRPLPHTGRSKADA